MDDLDAQYRELFNQFAPLLRSSGAALAEPEVAVYHATYLRNLYEALMDRGFGAKEALDIVCACSIGGAASSRSR